MKFICKNVHCGAVSDNSYILVIRFATALNNTDGTEFCCLPNLGKNIPEDIPLQQWTKRRHF